MRRFMSGVSFAFTGAGGAELLVVSGALDYGGRKLTAESWLRLPDGDPTTLTAADETLIWVKTGHLKETSEVSDWS